MDERAKAIVEPLTEATAREFGELVLGERDYLVLWMDAEGKKLLAEIKSLVPLTDPSRLEETALDGRKFERWGGPSWKSRDFWARIPECSMVDPKRKDPRMIEVRALAATDFTALLITALWPEERIIYRTEHARDLVLYLVERFRAQSRFAETIARFKVLGEVPQVPATYAKYWSDHPNPELRLSPYQRAAAISFLSLEAGGEYMDPGTGKTAIAIQRVCVEARRKRATQKKQYLALVVCPPQVRLNWQVEFRRFATTCGKVTVIRGGKAKRISLLTEAISNEDDCDFGVAVIGYDSFVESVDAFCMVPWDIAIFDESHKFKSHNTNRYDACVKVRNVARQRLLMTGTPIGNSMMDLYAQWEVMGEGMSGFANWKAFKQFHGVWQSTDESRAGVEKLVGVQNVPLLQERLARTVFMITKEEAGLQLPEKQPSTLEVEMTPKQADAYRQLAEELALEIEESLSGDVTALTVENVLTRLLRLSQITSGFVGIPEVTDDAGKVVRERSTLRIPGPNPKIDALIELLTDEDAPKDTKTVVWAHWVHDIQRISERLKAEGIEHACYYGGTPQNERDEIVRRFNHDPKMKVMVCNAQTAGEGLNLLGYCYEGADCAHRTPENVNTCCDRAVFFSQSWSSIARAQAEDRVHRRGTKRPIQLIDLVVPGTIDEEIRSRVVEKRDMAKTVTEIREVLRSVLGSIRGEVNA